MLKLLKVGLQAEETKPPIPGAGLCPGYTISRAILADAVCLTRGDRFLTVDFTRRYLVFSIPFTFPNAYPAYNLTSWGYQHCMVNPADSSDGGMLSKLLFRLLPDQYPADSIYAHFPFMMPKFMRACIASRSTDLVAYYDFSRPSQAEDNDRQLDILYATRMSRLSMGVKVLPLSEVSSELQRLIYADNWNSKRPGAEKYCGGNCPCRILLTNIQNFGERGIYTCES